MEETSSMSDFNTIYDAIMSRAAEHAPQPSLERITHILDLLGHPEQSFRVVQIAGTNGKGSTSYLTQGLIENYGLRTGLFTSPHLESVCERIEIDGESISEEKFVEIYNDIKDYIDMTDKWSEKQGHPHMSFFEVLTVMAIWAFADAPVEIAVIEVGLGGKWDSTNALHADVAIIGPIDWDHMEWLGNTLVEIAEQKAGIINDNATVIIGPQSSEEIEEVFSKEVEAHTNIQLLRDGHELKVLSYRPAVGGQLDSFSTPNGEYKEVPLKLFGRHQSHNALAAIAAAEVILPIEGSLNPEIIEETFSTISIPGRLEVVRNSPLVLLDGAHNPHAMRAVIDAIEENYHFQYLVGVVSIMKDKQVEALLSLLEPVLSAIVITQNSAINRVMPAAQLAEIAREVFGEDRVVCEPLMPNAIQTAVDLADMADTQGLGYGYGVLITGSFITAGNARRLLRGKSKKLPR